MFSCENIVFFVAHGRIILFMIAEVFKKAFRKNKAAQQEGKMTDKYLTALGEYVISKGLNIYVIATVTEDNPPEFMRIKSPNWCNDIYSITKVFTTTAVMMCCERGTLTVNDRVCDILADELPEAGMDSRWHDVTVHMALKHRTGLPDGHLDVDAQDARRFTTDWLRYLFTTPLEYTPGTSEGYSDGALYLLARIVEKVAGEDINRFLWHELFYPLKFQEVAWQKDPQGHPNGGSGMFMQASDVAKLGAIYKNGGVYQGRRYLTRESVDTVLARGYELHVRDRESGVYGKGGMLGQNLIILPKADRVVAYTGCGDNGAASDWIMKHQEF